VVDKNKIIELQMERQCITSKADMEEYTELYRDMQPGQNVYWNGFGDPPSLTYRADFNDIEFNRERQRKRELIKGRFSGGNLGWIVPEDLELLACMFRKPLDKLTERQSILWELIEKEGPMTIQQMKENTGMLVKEITPVLHRLQEAFLIYEDQYDGEWDRGWYRFPEMFPDIDLLKYSKTEALKILIKRFVYRNVMFDAQMVKSFFKVSAKEIKKALTELVTEEVLKESNGEYLLKSDLEFVYSKNACQVKIPVLAMHRNDFLVKSYEHVLKGKYTHSYPDSLYYLLIDGEFHGVVAGKFRYTPEVEDVILDISQEQAELRKDEILRAIHVMCGEENSIKRYQGEEI